MLFISQLKCRATPNLSMLSIKQRCICTFTGYEVGTVKNQQAYSINCVILANSPLHLMRQGDDVT